MYFEFSYSVDIARATRETHKKRLYELTSVYMRNDLGGRWRSEWAAMTKSGIDGGKNDGSRASDDRKRMERERERENNGCHDRHGTGVGRRSNKLAC